MTEASSGPAWDATEVLRTERELLAYYAGLLRSEGPRLRSTALKALRKHQVRYVRTEDADEVIDDAIAHLAEKVRDGELVAHRHPGLLYSQVGFSAQKVARRRHRERSHRWEPHPTDERSAADIVEDDEGPVDELVLVRHVHRLRSMAISRIRVGCVPAHGGRGLTEGRWNAFVRTERHRDGMDPEEPPGNATHQNARRARAAIGPVLAELLREELGSFIDEAPAIDATRWSADDLSEIAALWRLAELSWSDLESSAPT